MTIVLVEVFPVDNEAVTICVHTLCSCVIRHIVSPVVALSLPYKACTRIVPRNTRGTLSAQTLCLHARVCNPDWRLFRARPGKGLLDALK